MAIRIVLTKTGEDTWRFRDYEVERKRWILPTNRVGYFIIRDGRRLSQVDCYTLAEVRENISEDITERNSV